MVAQPQQYAGIRSEPPMSLPCATAPTPAATLAAAPPDDPPQVTPSGLHGLRVSPRRGLSVNARNEYSGVLVRPMTTAPARSRLRATGESAGAMTSARPATPFGVASPAWSTFSLIVTGTPWRGPAGAPSRNASSRARAVSRARSRRSTVTAFRAGLTASNRSQCASITSAHESLPERVSAAVSTALIRQIGLIIPSPLPLPLPLSRHRRRTGPPGARGPGRAAGPPPGAAARGA